MKFKLLAISFLILSSQLFAQTTKVKGSLSTSTYKEVSIMNLVTNETIKTVPIEKNNKFSFELEIKEIDIYGLYLDDDNYMVLILQPGEKVDVYYDLTDFKKITVKGSEETELYVSSVNQIRDKTSEEQESIMTTLINANPGKMTSVLLAFNLDFTTYAETHKNLIASLEPIKNNSLVQDYINEYNASTKLTIGSYAPEISLPDKDGNIINLSSLKGQYVLIDFWAAWCRPCRGENPNVVAAYNKYNAKGFTVYGVSLDNTKDSWVKAITDDKLGQWTNVSDLKGWNSVAGKEYNITSIPANFLIDPQGKIIGKNLRGAALEEKLAEIFK